MDWKKTNRSLIRVLQLLAIAYLLVLLAVLIFQRRLIYFPTRIPADVIESVAAGHGFGFPYLYDETQAVARAYDAVCTPDFFGFDAGLGLQYRGRFDASGRQALPGARRELREAMAQIAETGRGPAEQTPSMGCSIKWRA